MEPLSDLEFIIKVTELLLISFMINEYYKYFITIKSTCPNSAIFYIQNLHTTICGSVTITSSRNLIKSLAFHNNINHRQAKYHVGPHDGMDGLEYLFQTI